MYQLPDGSGFFTGSVPLPKDHWLYAPRTEEVPTVVLGEHYREAVKAAVRWAIRGATDCGKIDDFDPDALVLNACYALCGPKPGLPPTCELK